MLCAAGFSKETAQTRQARSGFRSVMPSDFFGCGWGLAGARLYCTLSAPIKLDLRFGLLLVSGAGASVWDWCSGWERRGRRLGASEQSSAGLEADRSGGGPKCWQRRSIPSESLAVFRPQARQVTAGGLKIASLSLHHYLLSCPATEDYSGDSEAERSC